MATPTTLPATFVSGAVLTAAQQNDLRGAFRVLQVVQGSTSTVKTVTSQTWEDSNLTQTITPTSSSSKVLVLVGQSGCSKDGASIYSALSLRLVRGSTSIQVFANYAGYNNAAAAQYLGIGTINAVFLDSPATTAATTYKTQMISSNGNGGATVQDNILSTVQVSTITLMEISA